MNSKTPRIVIIGGGAGGLELATRLGNHYRKRGGASVLLIDKHPFHVWKPLFHEVASGSLDVDIDGIDFRAHAVNHGFEFQLGSLKTIRRDQKHVVLHPIDDESGQPLIAERAVSYDLLVIAVGSITNDFAVPGVLDHCLTIDSTREAEQFHRRMLNQFLRIKARDRHAPLTISIVGAGATGVELTAELYKMVDLLRAYGFSNLDRTTLQVNLIEAGERILNGLPRKVSRKAVEVLESLGVTIRVNTQVKQVTPDGVQVNDDAFIPSDLTVWCAGVKCHDSLNAIGHLTTNRINQIVVGPTLQTQDDEAIYAIGDCAAYQQANGKPVPPRAQSAHQMASRAADNIIRQLNSQPLKPFEYKDKGSLVSFAEYTSVGVLGNMTRGRIFVEGWVAKNLYVSLYRLHQIALHGYGKTLLMVIVGRINRRLRPRLKLH